MINSNCNANKRIVGPSGVWEYDQLLGAKVILKSMPVSNFFGTMCSASDKLTIKDICFRISLDGKTITVIELEEYPGKIFTWKDLEIVEINTMTKLKPICGKVLCGQSICGYKVDTAPSYLEDLARGGGISVIDEKGNIITNRYIRILGADVENILTDPDEVTDIDINFNGDVLD